MIQDLLGPILERHTQLSAFLSSENLDYQSKEYRNAYREFQKLSKILQMKTQLEKISQDIADSKTLLQEESQPEMISFLQQEMTSLEQQRAQLVENMEYQLLEEDPNSGKNIFIEIRSGAGGDEANLFAGDIARMYQMFASNKGIDWEVIDSQPGDAGGYKDITLSIKGELAYDYFQYESGVHRVQRVPKTETQGRLHTSTITVAVIAETETEEFSIAPEDLKIETTRAQGAGGQHVNKTESAVKIYHIPTGIVVQCQDERSQHKNKEKALRILTAKVKNKLDQDAKDKEDSLRKEQIGSGDRAEKIRTYNFPQNRITDHRIGLTLHQLTQVLNGDCEELFLALRKEHQKKKLAIFLEKQGKLSHPSK